MPTSILRRYTPSTCTLEITARESPLSRWTGATTLKQVKFRLSFDGPHLLSDQHVSIRGDRDQLYALCNVVDAYVQNLLTCSPARFDHLLSLTHSEITTPALQDPHFGEFSGDRQSIDHNFNEQSETFGILLQPSGNLKHTLYFGTLAAEAIEPSTTLSTLELFDLASALDDYRTDTLDIPDLQSSQVRPLWSKEWVRIAAAVVLAVGVTATVTRFIDRPFARFETASTDDQSDELSAQSPRPRSGDRPDGFPETADQSGSSATDLELEQLPQVEVEPLPPSLLEGAQPLPESPSPSSSPVRSPEPSTQPEERADRQPEGSSSPSTIPPELAAIPPVDVQERSSQVFPPARDSMAPSAMPDSLSIASSPDARSEASSSGTALSRTPQPETSGEPLPDRTAVAPRRGGQGTVSTIPQLQEIRDYFGDRWQPPSNLTRSLEYQLRLNPDGTLQRVTPLGQAAGNYLDRTGMPLMGEAFVSPMQGGYSPQIRLILRPDGEVDALVELPN